MDMYDEAVVLVCFSDHGHASEIKEELHGCLLILSHRSSLMWIFLSHGLIGVAIYFCPDRVRGGEGKKTWL